jgi:hypothetical protein
MGFQLLLSGLDGASTSPWPTTKQTPTPLTQAPLSNTSLKHIPLQQNNRAEWTTPHSGSIESKSAVFGGVVSQSAFQLFLEPINVVELLQSFNQLARYRNIFLRQILDVPFGSLCDLLGVS